MKFKAKVAAVAVAAIATAGLAACSTGASSAAGVSTLTVWHNSADSPAVLNMYKAFEKDSGIKLDLVSVPSDGFESNMLTKWATGDRPDILEYHPTTTNMLGLNPAQNMQDLTDMPFVAKSGELYKSMGTVDGKVYAAITGFPSVFGIYYNKQVLASAGVKPPTSFADLTSLCSTLKPKGVAPIYESGGSAWPTQILPLMYLSEYNTNDAYGKEVASNKAALDASDSNFEKALAAYKGLGDSGCFNTDATSGTFENGLKAVFNGTAAMTALHSDVYATLLADANGDAAALDAKVGFVPVSATRATSAYAGGPLGTYFAPKTGKSDKEAAARKFVEYVTGNGYQALVNDAKSFPVISGVTTPTGFSELQKSYKAAYDTGTVAFNSNVAGFNGFATETSKLLAGQTTPAEAAKSMQAQVAQASKAAGIPGW